MDNAKQLGEVKVSTLLLKFSVPAIIGMMVNATYNLVDRIFIGNGVGSLGIAATTVGFPIMLITMAFSMLIGFGANSILSIRLGEQKRDEAEQILGNAVALLFGVGMLITIPGLIFLEPLLRAFGASDAVLPYAKDYMSIIIMGTTFQAVGFGMNNFIRAEGNPKMAMNTMLIGAVLNTILCPIAIFVLGWGIRGAGIATIFSQFVSMMWVLYYFFGGKSLLKVHAKNLKLHMDTVKMILTLGFAPFAMQIAASFQSMVLNQGLKEYGGDVAISAMGVTMSIITMILMPIFGINQGVQPIIGYNYGARKYDRVKEALKTGILAATAICVLGFVITRLFPEQLVSIFNSSDKELVKLGVLTMNISFLFVPIIGFQIVGSSYFQAVGKPKHATFLSLSRQVLILIPLLLILPKFFGFQGVVGSMPVSDILASIVTAIFLYYEIRHLDDSHTKSLDPKKSRDPESDEVMRRIMESEI